MHITDEQRADKYRHKLEDLLAKTGVLLDSFPVGSVPASARQSYDDLAQERRVVRVQLDVEQMFRERANQCETGDNTGEVRYLDDETEFGPCPECRAEPQACAPEDVPF